jgi:hypothetical protein
MRYTSSFRDSAGHAGVHDQRHAADVARLVRGQKSRRRLGLKPRSPLEPRPDSEQQLGQKATIDRFITIRPSGVIPERFSGGTRSDEKVTVLDSQTIIRLAVANSKMILSSDSLETVAAVRIHLPPPSSPSLLAIQRQMIEIRPCAGGFAHSSGSGERSEPRIRPVCASARYPSARPRRIRFHWTPFSRS